MRISRRQGMSELVCYKDSQIPLVWDEVCPLIQKALDRGSRYTLKDIYEGLCSRKMQLWCWRDEKIHAALVTTLQEDEVKFCLYLALGGSKMAEWAKYQPVVEDWARSKGCTEVRVYGRYGWKKLGFTPIYTKLVRKL